MGPGGPRTSLTGAELELRPESANVYLGIVEGQEARPQGRGP